MKKLKPNVKEVQSKTEPQEETTRLIKMPEDIQFRMLIPLAVGIGPDRSEDAEFLANIRKHFILESDEEIPKKELIDETFPEYRYRKMNN